MLKISELLRLRKIGFPASALMDDLAMPELPGDFSSLAFSDFPRAFLTKPELFFTLNFEYGISAEGGSVRTTLRRSFE